MNRVKRIVLSLLFMWMIPAASLPLDSYYFSKNEPKKLLELDRLTELNVPDWNQSRTVLEQSWLSSDTRGKSKYDIAKYPVNPSTNANLDHLELLAYDNVIFFNSNEALEQKLTDWIANGDPVSAKRDHFLRMRSAEVLLKLKPQNAQMLKALMKPLKESKNWLLRQNISRIYLKASPRLEAEMVNELAQVMVKDVDSPTRAYVTLTVLLHSENNIENLKKAVDVIMRDHRDFMQTLRPYSYVKNFLERKNNQFLETPSRPVSAELKKILMELISQYQVENSEHLGEANMVRNTFYRMRDM